MKASLLPVGWRCAIDKTSGRTYYYNKGLQQTTWQAPTFESEPPDTRTVERCSDPFCAKFVESHGNADHSQTKASVIQGKGSPISAAIVAATDLTDMRHAQLPSTVESEQAQGRIRHVWRQVQDSGTGRAYWYNRQTKATQWIEPSALERALVMQQSGTAPLRLAASSTQHTSALRESILAAPIPPASQLLASAVHAAVEATAAPTPTPPFVQPVDEVAPVQPRGEAGGTPALDPQSPVGGALLSIMRARMLLGALAAASSPSPPQSSAAGANGGSMQAGRTGQLTPALSPTALQSPRAAAVAAFGARSGSRPSALSQEGAAAAVWVEAGVSSIGAPTTSARLVDVYLNSPPSSATQAQRVATLRRKGTKALQKRPDGVRLLLGQLRERADQRRARGSAPTVSLVEGIIPLSVPGAALSPSSAPLQLCGWLWKADRGGGGVRAWGAPGGVQHHHTYTWRRRFFLTQRWHMLYYASDSTPATSPLAAIDLRFTTDLFLERFFHLEGGGGGGGVRLGTSSLSVAGMDSDACSDASLSAHASRDAHALAGCPCVLVLIGPGWGAYRLRAESEAEARDWKEGLLAILRKYGCEAPAHSALGLQLRAEVLVERLGRDEGGQQEEGAGASFLLPPVTPGPPLPLPLSPRTHTLHALQAQPPHPPAPAGPEGDETGEGESGLRLYSTLPAPPPPPPGRPPRKGSRRSTSTTDGVGEGPAPTLTPTPTPAPAPAPRAGRMGIGGLARLVFGMGKPKGSEASGVSKAVSAQIEPLSQRAALHSLPPILPVSASAAVESSRVERPPASPPVAAAAASSVSPIGARHDVLLRSALAVASRAAADLSRIAQQAHDNVQVKDVLGGVEHFKAVYPSPHTPPVHGTGILSAVEELLADTPMLGTGTGHEPTVSSRSPERHVSSIGRSPMRAHAAGSTYAYDHEYELPVPVRSLGKAGGVPSMPMHTKHASLPPPPWATPAPIGRGYEEDSPRQGHAISHNGSLDDAIESATSRLVRLHAAMDLVGGLEQVRPGNGGRDLTWQHSGPALATSDLTVGPTNPARVPDPHARMPLSRLAAAIASFSPYPAARVR